MKKKKKKKHPHAKKKTHHPKRAKKKKHVAHKRCPMCGHAAAHGRAGCTHMAGGKFCTCKSRH